MAKFKQQKIVINVEQKGDKQNVSMLFIPGMPNEKEFEKLLPHQKLLVNRAAAIGKYVRDIVMTMPEDF